MDDHWKDRFFRQHVDAKLLCNRRALLIRDNHADVVKPAGSFSGILIRAGQGGNPARLGCDCATMFRSVGPA